MMLKSLLLAGAGLASAFTFSADLEDAKLSPVQRVVKLLKEMQAQLESEQGKDQELYDKMVCWCETNKKEKTAAIAAADAKDKELVATIEENAAKKATAEAMIAQLKKEIAEDRTALKKATAIREKEKAEFMKYDTEMVNTITNLKNAIQVLGRHQAGLLQISPEMSQALESVMRKASDKYEELTGHKPQPKSAKGTAFLQSTSKMEAVFLQAVTAKEYQPTLSSRSAGRLLTNMLQGQDAKSMKVGYVTQSDGIYGILTQMLDEFNDDVKEAIATEEAAVKSYNELKASKEEEIATGEKSLTHNKQMLADASEVLMNAKQDLENTREQRSADIEFLRNLKLTCNDLDAQWEARTKERATESTAVAEAVAILTEDDNRELLAKSVSFIQKSSDKRMKAVAVLRKAAAASPNWDDLSFKWSGLKHPVVAQKPKVDLAALAEKAQLDSFTKVKAMMDKMVADIKAQMKNDVESRDYCREEFQTNARETKAATIKKEDTETEIESLENTIASLAKDIADCKKSIADSQTEIKKAGEDRELENKDFQSTVADQRATQTVLKKALKKLTDYYKKASLLQTTVNGKQTPPVSFDPMNKNQGASPVIALIEKIVADSKALEDESIKDESESQANYETFVADANNSIKQNQDSIVMKTKETAQAKEDKVNAETVLSETNTELEGLATYKADLHMQCDFVMKNFEVRQEAMRAEIEAIAEAKAILSGSGGIGNSDYIAEKGF